MEFQMTALVSFSLQGPDINLTPPGVIKLDPWLSPFKESLKKRYSNAQDWIKKIDETEGGLEKFSRVCRLHTFQLPPLTRAGIREVRNQP